MAEMTIRLHCNPETGKKDIIVSLKSDEDALPMEHEQDHKALVDKLIHGGLVSAQEVGKIVVEREEEKREAKGTKEQTPQAQRKSISQGE